MEGLFDLSRLFDPINLLSVPIVLFSLTLHEYCHAWAAFWGGDDTASLQGRCTLNPASHIDPIGTILVPLIGMLSSIPVIGWARPVPVNPMRLKKDIWMVWVAIAGPLSNLFLALLFAGVLKLGLLAFGIGKLPEAFTQFVFLFVIINAGLALFNMLPVPPLDGSRLLFHFGVNGRPKYYPAWEFFERFSWLFLYLIILAPGIRDWLYIAMSGLIRGIFFIYGISRS